MTEGQELQPTSVMSMAEFVSTQIRVEGQDNKNISPIGIILYANKSRLLFIGSREDEQMKGTIVCTHQDTPEGFDPIQIFDGKGRIIDLSEYEDLRPFQVQMGRVDIDSYRSIRTLPSITVRIHTKDPIRHIEEKVNIDETELLPIFTAETGGIAVFSGASLPEENAILVEKNNGERKTGLLFFMYPDTDALEPFDSVAGFYSFLQALNKEFIGVPGYPLQNQTLREFDAALSDGALKFGGIETRQEIFRTEVIANVRLAARLREPRYERFLDTFLPLRNKPAIALFARRILMRMGFKGQDKNHMASLAIDRLILGDESHRIQLIGEEEKISEERNIFLELQTSRARDILQKAGNLEEVESYERDKDFFEDMLKLIFDRDILAEVEDAITILRELESKYFQDGDFDFYFDMTKAPGKRVIEMDDWDQRGQDILNFLLAEALAKEKQLKADANNPGVIIIG